MKLREKVRIWGQDPNSHHDTPIGNQWNLPGKNELDPVGGCKMFGISNCCRVVMNGLPKPPFDDEADKLDGLDNVVWSIIGDAGSLRNNEETDVEEVIRIAKKHPNICGAIMDDFMREERLAIYTPEKLAAIRERLHTGVEGRELKLWNVVYIAEFADKLKPWMDQIDVMTVWNWYSEDLKKLEENYRYLKGLYGEDKPVYAGCYMYDYGNCKEIPMDLMKLQLDTYKKWLHEGFIQGIILCSNCIADIGLEAPEYTRKWLEVHGDEEI